MDHLPMTLPLVAVGAAFAATCGVLAAVDEWHARRKARHVSAWLSAVRARRAIRAHVSTCATCGATTIDGACIDGCGRR